MTRRRRTRLILGGLCAALCLTPSLAGGDVNLFVGRKDLDLGLAPGDEFFEPLEEQTEYGVLLTLDQEGWPVAFAIDLLRSSEETSRSGTDSFSDGGDTFTFDGRTTAELEVWELAAGVRKYFGGGRLQGYAGGGLLYVAAEERLALDGSLTVSGSTNLTEPISAEESSRERDFGFWVDAGLVYRIGRRINAGIDLRYSDASVGFEGDASDTDVGGVHYGVFVGYRWGR